MKEESTKELWKSRKKLERMPGPYIIFFCFGGFYTFFFFFFFQLKGERKVEKKDGIEASEMVWIDPTPTNSPHQTEQRLHVFIVVRISCIHCVASLRGFLNLRLIYYWVALWGIERGVAVLPIIG